MNRIGIHSPLRFLQHAAERRGFNDNAESASHIKIYGNPFAAVPNFVGKYCREKSVVLQQIDQTGVNDDLASRQRKCINAWLLSSDTIRYDTIREHGCRDN